MLFDGQFTQDRQSSQVPASMDTLSLAGLQAACWDAQSLPDATQSSSRPPGRACGLPSTGTASVLAERLATHVAEEGGQLWISVSGRFAGCGVKLFLGHWCFLLGKKRQAAKSSMVSSVKE